jgi:hypothetical protein
MTGKPRSPANLPILPAPKATAGDDNREKRMTAEKTKVKDGEMEGMLGNKLCMKV